MSKIGNICKHDTDDCLLTLRNILKFTYIHQNGCGIIYSEIWASIKIDFIEDTSDLKEVTTDEEEFRTWDGIDEDWQEFNRKNNEEDKK